ncbi:MAG: 4Fe-4S binding protein [Proteobacteria bacterium]|nr:4Fe-4S binding protein [Pseudomonadota bacterium]
MKIAPIRRTVQVLSLACMVAVPLLNSRGISAVSGSFYSVGIGPLLLTDPLIAIQPLLATMTIDTTLLASALIPAGFALVFGRVFCGWVCPQNILSELFDAVGRRLGLTCFFAPGPVSPARYVVLAVILAITLLYGFPLASLLSAPGIISVQTARLIYEGTVGLELALIGIVILAELFLVRRVWCNHICPVGSMLSLFRSKRTMRVVMAEEGEHACIHCRECAKACQLGLNPMGREIASQCHNCGACIDACREMTGERKPLSFRF